MNKASQIVEWLWKHCETQGLKQLKAEVYAELGYLTRAIDTEVERLKNEAFYARQAYWEIEAENKRLLKLLEEKNERRAQ